MFEPILHKIATFRTFVSRAESDFGESLPRESLPSDERALGKASPRSRGRFEIKTKEN